MCVLQDSKKDYQTAKEFSLRMQVVKMASMALQSLTVGNQLCPRSPNRWTPPSGERYSNSLRLPHQVYYLHSLPLLGVISILREITF